MSEERIRSLMAKNAELEKAIAPLVAIADAYDDDGLDEARPYWGDDKRPPESIELYQGRGGKQLLTLADCFAARDALRGGSANG